MLKKLQTLFGQINLITPRIDKLILKQLDLKYGIKQKVLLMQSYLEQVLVVLSGELVDI
jgi:hypothetical protein